MTAQKFNELFPVGAWVRFFPHKGDRNQFVTVKTKRPAWTLSSGKVVVPLTGMSTAVGLDQVEPAPVPQATPV